MLAREEVIQQAMALPPGDRAYVADVLEQSLTHGEFATPEVAAAWVAEIERRVVAYDRGELQAAGVETAIERIRSQLADHRARA
ncbi:MAG TPA: addiction module protein [Pirellulales bacterium]|jgi:putative addiction module component (TIGR02574 family)|nr:addiction module protein [Pirellulales bacterium]